MTTRKWLNVELTVGNTMTFTEFLRNNNIKYETSECYNLIHIEVYVNENERNMCDVFLEKLHNIY